MDFLGVIQLKRSNSKPFRGQCYLVVLDGEFLDGYLGDIDPGLFRNLFALCFPHSFRCVVGCGFE